MIQYQKIENGNRYQSSLMDLRKLTSIDHFFHNWYNEDKGYRVTGYYSPKDITQLQSTTTTAILLVTKVDDYLRSNLFTDQEKELLVYNLITQVATTYGKDAIWKIVLAMDKIKLFDGYGIKLNGEITEKMILEVIPRFEEESHKILVQSLFNLRKQFVRKLNEYLESISSSKRQNNASVDQLLSSQIKKKPPINRVSFTLKDYSADSEKLKDLFVCLRKFAFISPDTTEFNFKKIFSGSEIKTPIRWIGNISDLFYLINQIYVKHKLVEDLRQKQWEVTCICFVDSNGNNFDKSNFRSLKRPKLTSDSLDKAVRLLM